MPDDSHKVAFGLRMLATALAAKAGAVTDKKRVDLLRDALFFYRRDDEVVEVVLEFVGHSYGNPVGAGQKLLEFVSRFSGGRIEHSRIEVEAALARIDAEDAAGYLKQFAWQDRVDLNG